MVISPVGTLSVFTAPDDAAVLPSGMSFSLSLKNLGLWIAPGSDAVPTMRSNATGAGVNSKPKRVA